MPAELTSTVTSDRAAAFRDPPDVVAAGEVGDEDLDRGAGLREFGGELLQPVAATSDDHHRVHAPGELTGELAADTRGRARDDGRAAASQPGHWVTLRSCSKPMRLTKFSRTSWLTALARSTSAWVRSTTER